jgi:phosphoenolpyruvate carboxylase
MKGMADSEAIMNQLFAIPAYKKHVEDRGQVQTMMLGFSDGTKDGGYLKANWSIIKTKETLTRVCAEHEVKAIFFDGRGGPPARGGGKTHRFYAAQSNLIANNEIQLTIQGQTITSTYGTEDQFMYNCKQLLGAGLSNALYGERNIISDDQRALIERLSELSYQTYSDLKAHPMFLPYLENKSTLKYYGRANIGSRPGKRGGDKKLTLSDLRAISFVGSWSQLKQNVPGYFGIGSALQTLIDEGKLEELKALFNDVALFRALVLNSMMSLKKTNFNLTAYMANDPEYGPFWKILKQEFERSKELLLLISGYDILMEQEAISRMSVEIREHIVLPLLVIQQYGLQQISRNTANKSIYETMVTRSLYGNINASRNSA